MIDPITLAFAAARFVPEIVGWIGGDDAKEKAKKVVGVVENVTGLKGQAAVNALEGNADYQAAVRADLLEEMRLHAQDRASARNQLIELARAGHKTAWAPAILSLVVSIGFFGMLYFILKHEIPEGSRDVAYILLGTLGGGFVQVLNFWLGSSRSSQEKTALMARR